MKTYIFSALALVTTLQLAVLYTAQAQEAPEFHDPPRLYCRPFEVPLEGASAAIETNDATTELGRWVQKEESSYELFSVDFEIGQKATGYPQAWAYVCLSPRK